MLLASPCIKTAVCPTIWGLEPVRLHEHFWAARGVHVVRQGEVAPLPQDAELYLLTDPRTLCMFRLRPIVESLSWLRPQLLLVKLKNSRDLGYRESVTQDEEDRFVEFRRCYGGADARLTRVGLTREKWVAQVWQNAADVSSGWSELRHRIAHGWRDATTLSGRAYNGSDRAELAQFARDLVAAWQYPAATIRELRPVRPGVWAFAGAEVDATAKFVGNVWIGAGRRIASDATVIGPAALWDEPALRPDPQPIPWKELEVSAPAGRPPKPRALTSMQQATKRCFDIVFSLLLIILTLPLWLAAMAAIWFEDGRPFFFAHRRETLGGREFPCLKFRSMRKDADQIKARLAQCNQADGPQFYMEHDPRLTRVGRIIRKLNVDELPQFLNVLLGHMSVVGPRPSPRVENQCCPAWREARLSVRPGITGLWQVERTRRQGEDFQEWIKYDIQYVENVNWLLDLQIMCKTLAVLLRGGTNR
jgi:lipopolysaccharide/colanic/teichoic acid biosynthesis glycosyltransferase